MEQRLANAWRMTVNEKKFIETALLSDIRVDGRGPFDYRDLKIKFGREDGTSEVYLGQTYVTGCVTSQLVQPYRDRPSEGNFTIYTEFSPMADPSFEAGRQGELAIELGRIIDRGFRESYALDTESLCVAAGKWIWSIRIELHILDNGGNLVDAANIAALAALLTFRRPECTLGGEDGQEVIIHPPDVREPLPLIVHHLPIAVTFAFVGDDNILVIDPLHLEEAIIRGRLTVTINANGDVCAIQKAGGVGLMQSVIVQCLRIASVKAQDITRKIKDAVERHTSSTSLDVNKDAGTVVSDFLRQPGTPKLMEEHSSVIQSDDMEIEIQSSEHRDMKPKIAVGGPSCWDPYSKGIDVGELKATLAAYVAAPPVKKAEKLPPVKQNSTGSDQPPPGMNLTPSSKSNETSIQQSNRAKTLKDAVKPKHRRKKQAANAS